MLYLTPDNMQKYLNMTIKQQGLLGQPLEEYGDKLTLVGVRKMYYLALNWLYIHTNDEDPPVQLWKLPIDQESNFGDEYTPFHAFFWDLPLAAIEDNLIFKDRKWPKGEARFKPGDDVLVQYNKYGGGKTYRKYTVVESWQKQSAVASLKKDTPHIFKIIDNDQLIKSKVKKKRK